MQALEARRTHQPSHPLRPNVTLVVIGQFRPNNRRAIGPTGATVDGMDQRGQQDVSLELQLPVLAAELPQPGPLGGGQAISASAGITIGLGHPITLSLIHI